MNQKAIDRIVRIRKLSYSVIAFFTLVGFILSAFHGFLSAYPIVLYMVLVSMFGIFFAAIFLYPKYKDYPSLKSTNGKDQKFKMTKGLLTVSIIMLLFEVSILVVFRNLLGLAIALTSGIVFSFVAVIIVVKTGTEK